MSTTAGIGIESQVVSDLHSDEGFRAAAYRDSRGFLTIGIGTLIDGTVGGGITYEEAAMLCRNRVRAAIEDLDREMPWWSDLSPVRQRALVNVAYNLGIRKLRAFVNTLGALRRGDYEGASRGLLDSLWARQVGDRAVRLAKMIREG